MTPPVPKTHTCYFYPIKPHSSKVSTLSVQSSPSIPLVKFLSGTMQQICKISDKFLCSIITTGCSAQTDRCQQGQFHHQDRAVYVKVFEKPDFVIN